MKETTLKVILTAAFTSLTIYFGELVIPLIILFVVIISDYISGMVSAGINGELSSRVGFIGIVKKVCYFLAVGVGIIIDWVMKSALLKADIEVSDKVFVIGLLVIIWLIINELISILENLTEIGVPLPSFLTNIIQKLKQAVENKVDKGD